MNKNQKLALSVLSLATNIEQLEKTLQWWHNEQEFAKRTYDNPRLRVCSQFIKTIEHRLTELSNRSLLTNIKSLP